MADWLQFEEVEDLEEREKSWFETGGAEPSAEGGAAEADGAPGAAAADAPSVAAGAPAAQHCALCGDQFQQFYNEDKEEWHLRNSVRHDEQNYHPMCFEDYKASLTKEEPKAEESTDDVVSVEKIEEAIEIGDADEETNSQSDAESVVEVVEPEPPADLPEPVEIEEDGDEDDVIYKAEPVEEVVVEDEADTDDETSAARAERDRLAAVDFAAVRVKQEPVDPDDEPVITAEEESSAPLVETTQTTVVSALDGNVVAAAAPTGPRAQVPIRINISKSLPAAAPAPPPAHDEMLEDVSADDEPLPPGEEPELDYELKPRLRDAALRRTPPARRGHELSGLCCVM